MKKIILAGFLILWVSGLFGCGYVVVGGIGAAVGYIAKEKGYKVQSPVTKEKKSSKESASK